MYILHYFKKIGLLICHSTPPLLDSPWPPSLYNIFLTDLKKCLTSRAAWQKKKIATTLSRKELRSIAKRSPWINASAK